MTIRTFRNDGPLPVTLTFYTDPVHYQAGHEHSSSESTATLTVSPGALITFDDAEANGADILALVSSMTEA